MHGHAHDELQAAVDHAGRSADDPEVTSLDFQQWLVRFQDGGLPTDEQAAFEYALKADAAKRKLFVSHVVQSMLVHDRLRRDAYTAAPQARLVRRWAVLGSRAAAIAVGVLFGICGASIVLAYAVPTRSVAVSVLSEGFEGDTSLQAAGRPSTAGIWSGDYADIVGPSAGVRPFQGRRMLRFLRGDYEGRFIPESFSSDVFRIIDLRHLRAELRAGTGVMQLAARFNAAGSTAGEPFYCSLMIYAFDEAVVCRGEPLADTAIGRTALAYSRTSRERLDADPATWQRITNELRLPPETDFVMIRTGVFNDSKDPQRRTDEFGAHYVDDVQVVIGHRPELVGP